jgi:hypothetical protein
MIMGETLAAAILLTKRSFQCAYQNITPADLTADNAFVFYVQMNVTCHVFSGQKVTDAPQFGSHIAQRTDQWLPSERVYIHASYTEGFCFEQGPPRCVEKGFTIHIYTFYFPDIYTNISYGSHKKTATNSLNNSNIMGFLMEM